MPGVTRALAEFAANLTYDDIPEEVAERTKLLIFDTVGIALRARHDAESTPPMMAAVRALSMDHGNGVVVGDDATYSPAAAAFINGSLAHSLDFDDTHAGGSLHSSAPIVPAAFAAADMVGADGKTVIAAIVAGYEVQIRLSLALGPSDHYNRGYHPTATCGSFGAAAAAGIIFGFTVDQMIDAFGIVGSQTSGTLTFLPDGAWTKRSQVGHAAYNGLLGATLAREGYQGVKDAFECKFGFFHAYAPNPQPEIAAQGLGEKWETMSLAVKPYPSCRYTHAPLDGLSQLRVEHGIKPGDIERVDIGIAETGMNLVAIPEQDKQSPESVVDGQFSMAFVGAVMLRKGNMEWDDYKNHLTDQETLALTKKVFCAPDNDAEAIFPDNMAGKVKVTTVDGEYETFISVPKGEPDNFVTAAELQAKFDGLVGPYLSDGRRAALTEALLGLENADDVSAVMQLSRPDAVSMQMAGED